MNFYMTTSNDDLNADQVDEKFKRKEDFKN